MHSVNELVDTARENHSGSKKKVICRQTFHENKMVDYLKNYCKHTTLHGFSYLVDPDLSFIARCFWYAVMTISCCLMIVTVNNQIRNFTNNRIVMAHNGKALKLNDIPFPALSFCSDNQIKPSDMNLTKLFSKGGNYTANERHFLSVALSLCHINKHTINYEEIKTKSDIKPIMLILTIIKDCRSNIRELKWNNKDLKDPCAYMNASITIDGGCYSFNQVQAFSDNLFDLAFQRSCNIADMECVKRLYYSGSSNTSNDLKTQYSACNCLPSCVELKYNFKVNDMPWNFSSLERKYKKKSSFVGLHITYKGGSVNVIERDCVYTFSSLIASIGGVMGLFMGFSTISFFEIIYYTIIKWLKFILSRRGNRRVEPDVHANLRNTVHTVVRKN
ncbi:uncharacterized protein LOC111060479 [Nilaparvata lugens]|uniref:uncharacterized protein LOC111060479 n=1 Tax=Nilaparvata lugens TaxID=108931 RepID=UPI00193E8792|nr:uncharacterized protein LOC111060479 [Nilaparvata lugens]